ncbi:ricin-type beta-trefoil lectin domain protein [Streptomyces cellostaticus]|uniref:ricin-type beta-trefoil lectin domain protein n=1 Tax=Streptomyces cellostaticus TaxID=67285 RepID=UPI0020263200|nr:ricin-type beta-trefoil lectin domain protein [Streptomyces cellostaticus]
MTHWDTGSADRLVGSAAPTLEPLSDAELTRILCAQGEEAEQAALELRRRHLAAVLFHARAFTTHQMAGNQLAAEAFARAVEELRDGVDPLGTWRHHALTQVGRTAWVWAADSRQERLQAEFLVWVRDPEPPPASRAFAIGGAPYDTQDVLLRAFYQLPERSRGVLWYSVVDEEPDDSVGRYLGVPPATVPRLRDKAQLTLRSAFVQEHLEYRGTAECRAFCRIIEKASPAEGERRPQALLSHLSSCARCAQLLAELTGLSDEPRTFLATGLLMWGGAAYAAGRPVRGIPEPGSRHDGPHAPGDLDGAATTPAGAPRTAPPAGTARRSRPAHRSAPRHRALAAALATGAVAVVAVVAANALLDHGRATGGSAPHRPPAGPSTSASPPPSTRIRVGVTAQLVHTSTGLCLDVMNGKVQKRTNAVATTCVSAPTQQWSLDREGRLHNMAAPDFCLKADGNAAGIGIRPCDTDNPEKRSRLIFMIERDGVIRPRGRPDEAVVPLGTSTGEPLLLALKGRASARDQAWAARPVAAG